MNSIFILQQEDDGLTLGEVLQNIPHDGPAVVVYVMLAIFVGFIWMGSRNSGKPDTTDAGHDPRTETSTKSESDPVQDPPRRTENDRRE